MSRQAVRSATLAMVLGATLLSRTTTVQAAGFAVDRFDPSERGSEWFVTDSLDFRGHGRVALGVIGDWAYKPLVFYRGGEEVTSLVRHQLYFHLGGSIVFWDRLRLGVNLPLLAYTKGKSGTLGGDAYNSPSGTALGDLRLSADLRLVGQYRSWFTLSFGTSVFLPTGDQSSYASDGKSRLVPRFLAATEVGAFVAAAKLGFQYRPHDTPFAGSPMGSEMVGALSAGLRSKDGKLIIGPEITASTVVTKGSAVFARRTTPFELLFGAHYLLAGDWRIGAGVGPGMSRGLGSPVLRVVGAIEWAPQPKKTPPPPPKDRDLDGIWDENDACIDEPGIASTDPKKHGCPKPSDRDKDGIIDNEDACVDEPGIASADPKKHGCPKPSDRDKDGIIDEEDACVEDPGVPSDDPKKNGCPLPKDRDGDKIFDPDDACPDNPGAPNSDPKKHGCPKVIVTETQIQILERVEFETGKARILPESETILNAVLSVLKDNPKISRLSVEGHTDSRADDNFNLGLSRRRAAAVVKWLVDRGIDKNRLTSQGFGETRPLQSNDSDEGRKNNRRVEFHILEENGKPVDHASSTTTTKSSKSSHE